MTLAKQIAKNLYQDVVPKIGLEVHAQLNINSKLFSRAANSNAAHPNSQLDLLDISLPGSLPKLNRSAVKSAILTAFGLNCTPQIAHPIHFDRKNYFYPDMPAGFQITQFNEPIAKYGHLDFIAMTYDRSSPIMNSLKHDMYRCLGARGRSNFDHFEPYLKRSQIKQIQLEQDSAKTLQHISQAGEDLKQYSLIDYNRSGAALIEIVFEPDLENHHEASSSIKELVFILRTLGTCDCEFQEGSIRVDANISIHSICDFDFENSARVELKNLNSLKSLNNGISYEIKRQAEMIKSGKKVIQETRSYDTKLGETLPLRLKEEAVDYRYVPEPSIPPLQLDQQMIEEIKGEVPVNLPCNIRKRLREHHDLDYKLIAELMDEPGLDEYFEEVMSGRANYDADVVADFLLYTTTNLKEASKHRVAINLANDGVFRQRITPEKMQSILDLKLNDEISFSAAYHLVKHLISNDTTDSIRSVVENLNWYQINDENEIEVICVEGVRMMKNISSQYKRKGETRHLRMMVEKLGEVTENRINIRKTIKCLDGLLNPPNGVRQ